MKFKLKDAEKFGWEGLKGWSYNSAQDFPGASGAYFEITGGHGKVKSTKSDRVYLVLDGEGEFVIDNEKISVEKTDVVIVPKNTPYNYKVAKGTLKLFLVHTPAYNEDAEVSLD